MKSIRYISTVIILIPSLLLGWGNDVIVETLHNSENQYPVAHDIVWPSDTNMIIAVAYNVNDADGHIDLLQSRDNGQNWTLKVPISWVGHKVQDVRLEYDDVFLFVLWVCTDGYLNLTVYDVELNTPIASGSIVAPPIQQLQVL